MRILTKVLPIIVMGLMLAVPANAQFGKLSDLKIPSVDVPAWKTGQSVTYTAKISGLPDVKGDLGAKLRIALVGTEMVEGQEFYWLEYDLSDLIGMPSDMPMPFKMLKVKFLIKQISPDKFNKDPKAMMKDIAEGRILKKAVFQMDEQTPQMIDFMTVQGLIQGMTGQDMSQLIDQLPVEQEKPDPNVKFDSKTGKETVTVAAGTFTDATYLWFSGSDPDGAGEGKVHAHAKVPLFGLVKMAMSLTDKPKDEPPTNVKVNIELVGYETTGAKSLITGTPVPFDFMQFMSGGMMGGMEMQ